VDIPAVLLRRAEIFRILDVNPVTLWRWRKTGDFPAPIKLTSGNLRWRKKDLDTWLESRCLPEGGVSRPIPP
jgi:prophage regulatory protein